MTTPEAPPGEFVPLKTDVLGRAYTPATERETLMDAFEASGLSGAEFCRQRGLRYTTFASWRKTRRNARRALMVAETTESVPSHPSTGFAEVDLSPIDVTADATSDQSLCIRLPGGTELLATNHQAAKLAATLLRALENGSSC